MLFYPHKFNQRRQTKQVHHSMEEKRLSRASSRDGDDGEELDRRRSRLTSIRKRNPTCADCCAPDPQWASLLLHCGEIEGLCVLVCTSCIGHHHQELGEERCVYTYLEYAQEFSDFELDILELSGNARTNMAYEAFLPRKDPWKDSMQQEKFITQKYNTFLWGDANLLSSTIDFVSAEAAKAEDSRESTKGTRTWSSGGETNKTDLLTHSGSISDLSQASDLLGSSWLNVSDLTDDEDCYLECARRTSPCPEADQEPVNLEHPGLRRFNSDESFLNGLLKDHGPLKPSRRVSNDPQLGNQNPPVPVPKRVGHSCKNARQPMRPKHSPVHGRTTRTSRSKRIQSAASTSDGPTEEETPRLISYSAAA